MRSFLIIASALFAFGATMTLESATARRYAFAEFLVVAHAGAALLGGQFLGEAGLRNTEQGGGGRDDA